MTADRDKKWSSAKICLGLAVALSLGSVMSGLGTRWEWWGFRPGLDMLRWTVYGEIALAVVSLACLFVPAVRFSGKGSFLLLTAMVLSLAAASIPVHMWMVFRSVPMIHDITTDTEKPPQFDAVLKLRKNALNPVAYGGQEIADQQHKAYPDILPLVLDVSAARAFQRCLAAAERLGWKKSAKMRRRVLSRQQTRLSGSDSQTIS